MDYAITLRMYKQIVNKRKLYSSRIFRDRQEDIEQEVLLRYLVWYRQYDFSKMTEEEITKKQYNRLYGLIRNQMKPAIASSQKECSLNNTISDDDNTEIIDTLQDNTADIYELTNKAILVCKIKEYLTTIEKKAANAIILKLKGFPNNQISDKLNISKKTVARALQAFRLQINNSN